MSEVMQKSEHLLRFEETINVLQSRITDAVSEVDGGQFEFKDWIRPEGGGGRMAMLRGSVIEKGAVHVSKVQGGHNPLTGRPFYAAGLSLILHPRNPHAATVHMNIRRFEETDDAWWGGGMDLTPMGVWHVDDVIHFHGVLRDRLGEPYEQGRQEADEYFHIPHRNRVRGAGGVFYDHLPRDTDGVFIERLGDTFLDAYMPILDRRADQSFDEEARERQLHDRGVYVEFNLLYDRGTRFGLESGGNVEAILSSLPPRVAW